MMTTSVPCFFARRTIFGSRFTIGSDLPRRFQMSIFPALTGSTLSAL